MKGTDVKCPECGTINKSLFLEETEGNYECVHCGYCGTIEGYNMIMVRAAILKRDTAGEAIRETRFTPLPV